MFSNTPDAAGCCAPAYHTHLVHLLQKGEHVQSDPEDMTKKPCSRHSCFACLHSHPTAHGQEQRQLGGVGEGPGLCFLLGVHCSLGAGVFRMQSSSSPAHYSPNMPSRSCLPKPLPSLIQCYQIPNVGTLKQMFCYQHATGHIFQKENSCSLNLSLGFSAPRTQRKSLRRACFPSFSSSVLKVQQAPSLSVQPSRSATHSP